MKVLEVFNERIVMFVCFYVPSTFFLKLCRNIGITFAATLKSIQVQVQTPKQAKKNKLRFDKVTTEKGSFQQKSSFNKGIIQLRLSI